jgi:hypothetical protein
VRHLILGFLAGLIAAVGFSLLASVAICCGIDPEVRPVSDAAAPLFGVFLGAYFAARKSSWIMGTWIGILFILAWFEFWLYVSGRLTPLLWFEEGIQRITVTHLFWWGLAFAAGLAGGVSGRIKFLSPFFLTIFLCLAFPALILAVAIHDKPIAGVEENPFPGFEVERHTPADDGTVQYLLTFDFQRSSHLSMGLYDCDSDDANPYDDTNTSYMGQSLRSLVEKLSFRAESSHRQLLGVINGGFFGASGPSIAHHEEPIVEDGQPYYDVDLMQPKDQAWFFAVRATHGFLPGVNQFVMAPSIPRDELPAYQTVLGGVRPLRFEGKSMPLEPGAGNTSLRCSRTSIGWSADAERLYILVVRDPDGEAASELQRKTGATQTGGWDVGEVQQFWEKKDVPFAILLDGGESTQLAFYQPGGKFRELLSGYQYSFTVGYLFQKPLLFTLPILPPGEAHRGVLNYLYVDGPAKAISQ